jgi:hypothetical protein
VSEDQLLDKSMSDGDATEKRRRADSGGTFDDGQVAILNNNGVPASEQSPTPQNIQQAVANGQGVITNHDVSTLWGPGNTGFHAINVVGIQYDGNGNPINVITIDTGQRPPNNCPRIVPYNQYVNSIRPGQNMAVTNGKVW